MYMMRDKLQPGLEKWRNCTCILIAIQDKIIIILQSIHISASKTDRRAWSSIRAAPWSVLTSIIQYYVCVISAYQPRRQEQPGSFYHFTVCLLELACLFGWTVIVRFKMALQSTKRFQKNVSLFSTLRAFASSLWSGFWHREMKREKV